MYTVLQYELQAALVFLIMRCLVEPQLPGSHEFQGGLALSPDCTYWHQVNGPSHMSHGDSRCLVYCQNDCCCPFYFVGVLGLARAAKGFGLWSWLCRLPLS